MPPIHLESAQLVLREASENDLPALREMLASPKQVQFVEFDATESSARVLLDWSLRTAQEQPRTAYGLVVTLRSDPETAIGTCSLVVRDPALREGHLGIILSRQWQAKGIALEAGSLLLELGFERLGLHRVCGGCHAENRASLRLMEKAGLRHEGFFRESHWEKGKWHDRVVYALLDHEWWERRREDSNAA